MALKLWLTFKTKNPGKTKPLFFFQFHLIFEKREHSVFMEGGNIRFGAEWAPLDRSNDLLSFKKHTDQN